MQFVLIGLALYFTSPLWLPVLTGILLFLATLAWIVILLVLKALPWIVVLWILLVVWAKFGNC